MLIDRKGEEYAFEDGHYHYPELKALIDGRRANGLLNIVRTCCKLLGKTADNVSGNSTLWL
jgi:hypothetical protein